MEIEVANSTPLDVYQALVGIITPRPIAWVTSINKEGQVNLAPFSFFNMFGSNPPVVVFSPTTKRDGTKKDTLRNLMEVPEFVLNGAAAELAEQINLTSKEIPYGESEVELAGLETTPSLKVIPPRLVAAKTHLECKVLQILPIGTGPSSANLVIGEVLHIHIAPELLDSNGKIDPKKNLTTARLGGDWWCNASDLLELKRPIG